MKPHHDNLGEYQQLALWGQDNTRHYLPTAVLYGNCAERFVLRGLCVHASQLLVCHLIEADTSLPTSSEAVR